MWSVQWSVLVVGAAVTPEIVWVVSPQVVSAVVLAAGPKAGLEIQICSTFKKIQCTGNGFL